MSNSTIKENTTDATTEEVKTYIYDQRAIQSVATMLNQLVDTDGLVKCDLAININKLLSSPIQKGTYIHSPEK